jgi:hypothetical protein
MKDGIKTTEFWAMIISTITGLGVMSGIVEPGAKDSLTQVMNSIVGAAMTILPGISYILSRTWLKAKTPTEIKNG